MKTYTFRLWKSNRDLLTDIQRNEQQKRGQILSKNLILNEALKTYKEFIDHD